MSSRAVDAANSLVDSLDDGSLIPSREFLESMAELNGALARWAQREQIPLKVISTTKRKQA